MYMKFNDNFNSYLPNPIYYNYAYTFSNSDSSQEFLIRQAFFASSPSSNKILLGFVNPNNIPILLQLSLQTYNGTLLNGGSSGESGSSSSVVAIVMPIIGGSILLILISLVYKACAKKRRIIRNNPINLISNANNNIQTNRNQIANIPANISYVDLSLIAMPKMKYLDIHIEKFDKNIEFLSSFRCSVCLEEFYGPDVCRVTICMHVFHQHCLAEWLMKHEVELLNQNCPNCKTVLSRQDLLNFLLVNPHGTMIHKYTGASKLNNQPRQSQEIRIH